VLAVCLTSVSFAIAPVAGPDWLEVEASPGAAIVHTHDDRSDAVVHLELRNRTDHRVKVIEVRIAYLAGARTIRLDTPGGAFFRVPGAERSSRIERDASVRWRGICLRSPPVGADRVRFELDLVGRRNLRKVVSTQAVDVPLVSGPLPVRVRLPFQGYWRVSQGHTCSTNHRRGGLGGEFAWDFAAIDASGQLSGDAYRLTGRNRDSFSFGQPVLAPADGSVVRVATGVSDNEGLRVYPRSTLVEDVKRPEWVFGNFVVLKMDAGAYVLLAHLQQGSITVREGQRVEVGDPIARCGNSGNTVDPHVHLQIMDGPDPVAPQVRSLPGEFVDYTEFVVIREGEPRDLLMRRVHAGDPPEGAVVAPSGSDPAPFSRPSVDP
jgi:hypothetical protein